MEDGNLFVNGTAFPGGSGQSPPSGTAQSAQAMFPLAPLLKGRLCPQHRPTLTRRHQASERRDLISVKTIFTLSAELQPERFV